MMTSQVKVRIEYTELQDWIKATKNTELGNLVLMDCEISDELEAITAIFERVDGSAESEEETEV